MKKWLVYLLGIITGVILTFAFAFYVNLSNNSGIVGLEMFEEPGWKIQCKLPPKTKRFCPLVLK